MEILRCRIHNIKKTPDVQAQYVAAHLWSDYLHDKIQNGQSYSCITLFLLTVDLQSMILRSTNLQKQDIIH